MSTIDNNNIKITFFWLDKLQNFKNNLLKNRNLKQLILFI